MNEYSREELIGICERAIVPEIKWCDRDTPRAQVQLYQCYGLLMAGCDFHVVYHGDDNCVTNDRTIWLYVMWKSFATFDHDGPEEEELFYLPTEKRLEGREGSDWY